MLKTTAFIFARGGSKGVLGKNSKLLAGKPLIAYAIETALKSKYVQRVVVSTDDANIAEIAKKYGAEVPFMRPAELAKDDSPEWLAWRHAIEKTREIYGADACPIFLSTPATCPFREAIDIDNCVEALINSPEADIVIATTPSHNNPYFTMANKDAEGFISLFAKPEGKVARRQDAPKVYDIVGVVYAAKPDFVLRVNGLWEGKVKSIDVPQERTLDIDTQQDFLVADLLMKYRLGIIK